MQSNFNHINIVPIGNEFFDHLTTHSRSRVSSSGFKLNRLRKLYTRQVAKTQLTFSDKLSTILRDFPLLHDIHPLYTDLLRFVFDKDRYSFSLGQVNTARRLIQNIADDYLNLLEFVGSVRECRALKASAVAGMFSVVNEITPGLAYLEQLRQHMVKLPLIDPNVATLLVAGYPHGEKACFVEGVVDFVAKSVAFDVGFTDYNGLMRCQVIDAPGVLDKPVFGECNVVVDALARRLGDAIVLFFLDVSGSCGYSVADQVVFFHSVKAVFVERPLLVVCDESDLMRVSEQDWELIEEMMIGGVGGEEEEVGLKISDLRSEEGVISVKNVACERLLDQRGRLSCIALEEARVLRNKYIVAHQELDRDDDHEVSDLFVDPDVLFRLEEQEHAGIKHAEEEQEEEEEDFVMAEKRFPEEHKDQLVASIHKIHPLRILIAFGFCILVGNTYGAVQQCLSTLSF
ncbi:hypothetical protein Bca52824_025537 [Brassica carinata]|uniref:Nucleolar GTP-binding protein 1 n=1 Tax=Brassica carinata TaxID=52824 RepID=A0A8X7V7Z4_BRACI|nr:hypothetical protein Bca52824_025537 [Brassica carinata]